MKEIFIVQLVYGKYEDRVRIQLRAFASASEANDFIVSEKIRIESMFKKEQEYNALMAIRSSVNSSPKDVMTESMKIKCLIGYDDTNMPPHRYKDDYRLSWFTMPFGKTKS